jgi:hypothetical protein
MLGLYAAPSFAEGKAEPKAHAMTKEQREKMAVAHEKMAACLRSDRALDECHGEMMKTCEGEGGCPMHGMMGKGHMGKMGHGSMHHEDKK